MNLPIAFASFISAGIEFMETAAIAYALGKTGYPREAIIGTILGTLLVLIPAVFVWPLFRLIPIHFFELAVGVMLLWLGLSWCMKSIHRKLHHQRAGWIQDPLRGYKRYIETTPTRFSYFTALIMTKSAAIEGFEVCMIVTAMALASGNWLSALVGAFMALLATVSVVFSLHGKLQRVPDVSLKLWAGVVLSMIGMFWVYEGLEKWIS